jgi:hypothetical protein
MSRRSLSWVAAVRDIKDDRATRLEVRFEAVKSYTRGIDLCAWRGRSGRRYACRMFPLDATDGSDLSDAVLIGFDDSNTIVGVRMFGGTSALAELIEAGATKLCGHMLAETAAERAEIARDLRPLADEVAA